MPSSIAAVAPALVALGIWVGSVLWVRADARSMAEQGHPVVVRIGGLEIRQPEVWALWTLVVWVLFFPLYLATRRHS